jgi:hypothetical protein
MPTTRRTLGLTVKPPNVAHQAVMVAEQPVWVAVTRSGRREFRESSSAVQARRCDRA